MKTQPSMRRLPLLLVLFSLCSCLFTSCMAPAPSVADVAADRARWTAVRDLSADGVVDAQEAPALGDLLVAWDEKLTADEAAARAPQDPQAQFADLLRVYGGAALEVFSPKLREKAPQLFDFADRNGDGALDQQEVLTLDWRTPVMAVVVVHTAHQMIRRRR